MLASATAMVKPVGVAWLLCFMQHALASGKTLNTVTNHIINAASFVDTLSGTNEMDTTSAYNGDQNHDKNGGGNNNTPLIRNIAVGVGSFLLIIVGIAFKRFLRRRLKRNNSTSSDRNQGFTSPSSPRPSADAPALATIPENGDAPVYSTTTFSNNDFLSNYSTYSTPYSYSNFN